LADDDARRRDQPRGDFILPNVIILLWRINPNSQTRGGSSRNESCSSCVVEKNEIRDEKLLKIKKK